MDVLTLPFNALIGLTRSSDAGSPLSLPADPCYTNHLGTVHASALFSLAEATSGDCLQRECGDLPFPVFPVVRRVEVKYRRPARGAITATGSIAGDEKAAFLDTLTTRGRATIKVDVAVADEHGTQALAATFEWFVARADQA